MKRLLFKIVFFGLTLGLMPQGIFAMYDKTSIHSMQLRSRTRSNSVGRTTPGINDPITQEEHRDFLHLYPNELDQKYPPSWRERIKIWKKIQDDEMNKYLLPAPTAGHLDYYLSKEDRNTLMGCGKYCFSMLSTVIFINLLFSMLLSPECPTLNPTYKAALQIDNVHTFNGILQDWSCHLESKKYGKLLPIDHELQETASPAFAFMQLESIEQDGPTCAKYAFANLVAIDKLYRGKRSIHAKTIAEEIQLPLNVIGLHGKIEWKPFDSMQLLSVHPQNNDILNYANRFFPKENFFIWWPEFSCTETTSIQLREMKIMIDSIITTIEKHGLAHVFIGCDTHATAISIIKEADNKYRAVYMNSHNNPLSSVLSTFGWDTTKHCYQYLKTLTINLRDKFTQKNTISLNDATKN